MKVLIIDQCSGRKNLPDECTELDAGDIDANPREELFNRPDVPVRPARDLYDGRQQRYIDTAVETLRASGNTVKRYFVSAGFGLLEETEPVPAYNVRFKGKEQTRERAEKLELSRSVAHLFEAHAEYDLTFIPLGKDYYRAIDIDRVLQAVPDSMFVVLFNRTDLASKYDRVLSLPANSKTGSELGGGAIGVKGTYLQNFASAVTPDEDIRSTAQIREYCNDHAEAQQTDVTDFEK